MLKICDSNLLEPKNLRGFASRTRLRSITNNKSSISNFQFFRSHPWFPLFPWFPSPRISGFASAFILIKKAILALSLTVL